MKVCKPKTMKQQIIRGIIGIGLLVAAGFAYKEYYALSFLLVALSLIPLKGCPVCWVVETCEVAGQPKSAAPDERKTGTVA
ncbi:MAG: hypothetical protein PSY14_15970 [bacterium]|nr:hypothetical protein [bacterium]